MRGLLRVLAVALLAAPAAAEVVLLDHPHPYRAALTVASDTHATPPERFEAVHALVNGTDRIARGSRAWGLLFEDPEIDREPAWAEGVAGFGLPIADNLYLYHPEIGIFADFDPETRTPRSRVVGGVDQSARADAWIRRGWVDALHTGGPGEITRDAMTAGLAWLGAEPHRRLEVWVSHYPPGTPGAIEPDRGRALPRVLRNAVRSGLRVLGALGIREVAGRPTHLRAVPLPRAQRGAIRAWVALAGLGAVGLAAALALPALRGRRAPALVAAAALLAAGVGLQRLPLRYGLGDNPGSPYYCLDRVREAGFRFFWFVSTGSEHESVLALPERSWNGRRTFLKPVRVDDGSRLLAFPRSFAGAGGVRSLDLLGEAELAGLVREGGTAILFVHWASDAPRVFTARGLRGLDRLRRHHEAGRIWVAPTSEILRFHLARAFLDWEVRREGARAIVDVRGIDHPLEGPIAAKPEDLAGISFRADAGEEIEVRLRGRPVPPDRLDVVDAGGSRVVRFRGPGAPAPEAG